MSTFIKGEAKKKLTKYDTSVTHSNACKKVPAERKRGGTFNETAVQ